MFRSYRTPLWRNSDSHGTFSASCYAVTVVPGGRKVMFTGRNVLTLEGKHTTFKVISGLKPGTYTFRISAVNEAGAGEPAVTGPVTLR